MLDRTDRKILDLLQKDCMIPASEIGDQVGLSTTPCWRRIQKLLDSGLILRRVAIIDPNRVNVGMTVFVSVTTGHHTLEWLDRFRAALRDVPEVVEIYRMSGQPDYLLRVVVPDIERYDAFYMKLISKVELFRVSAAFAVEHIKSTTALPLDYAGEDGGRARAVRGCKRRIHGYPPAPTG